MRLEPCPEGLAGIADWTRCQYAGRVRRKRTMSEKVTEQIIYYITSLDFEAEQFGKAVGEHWGMENVLHWALHVIFNEHGHRYQK